MTPRRILFTGLGKRDSVTEKVIKDVFGAAIRKAREIGLNKIVVAIDTFCSEDISPQRVCELITLATINGLYRYEDHISEKSEKTIKEVILNTATPAESSVISYTAIADAINLARDLANAPANFMTPSILSDIAEREATANGIEFERLDENGFLTWSGSRK